MIKTNNFSWHVIVFADKMSNFIIDYNKVNEMVRSVEVGRVWLELPSPIILLNQIQAVLGNPIQLGL